MKKNSLIFRILSYLTLFTLTFILAIFLTFEEAGRRAIRDLEHQKAQEIVKTVVPIISLDLYLGLQEELATLADTLIKHNKNILGVTIFADKRVVYSQITKPLRHDYMLITQDLYKPSSQVKIGKVHILFATSKSLTKKYTILLILFLIIFIVGMVLFGFYLERLLHPLKKIAKELSTYTPTKKLHLTCSSRNDEIELIAKAILQMHKRIVAQTHSQEKLQHLLEKKVQEKTQELEKRFYIDPLTGLANRLKLLEDLKKLKNCALILINIDNFKEINDFFGHQIGDRILVNFAQKITNLLQTNNPQLYRISGDEFALLFKGKMSKSDIEYFLEMLGKKIENMIFFHGDKGLSLHVTMGASLQKEGALEKADIALKKARKLRKQYAIYLQEDSEVEKQYQNNIEWIKKLKKSIELDRIVPFFQPIVHVESKRPKGYECLVRIIDDGDISITPHYFLEVAKKSRFYFKLTEIMIQKSCAYFQESSCSFSINLSIMDIFNPEIVSILEENIKRYGVNERIILEIVESEGVENYEKVYAFATKMKALGCQIAIDDFGTGYSNFKHILKLPIDYIKIDGSLVKNICSDPDSELIVSTIVDFAKKKGLKTVSEYVSDEAIYQKIKELGVDFAQGYYFDKPKQFVEKNCIF